MSGKQASPAAPPRVILFTAILWGITLLAATGAVLLFASNVGLTNWEAIRSLLSDGWFRRSVWLSAATATTATGIAILVGLPAAYALSRYGFPGKAVLETLFASVIVLPASTLGLFLMVAFQYPPVLAVQERLGFRVVHSLPGHRARPAPARVCPWGQGMAGDV